MTNKDWEDFLEWLYKNHQLAKSWKPNKISIELWEEYKEATNYDRK